jgi:hypothetical protein
LRLSDVLVVALVGPLFFWAAFGCAHRSAFLLLTALELLLVLRLRVIYRMCRRGAFFFFVGYVLRLPFLFFEEGFIRFVISSG